MDLASKLKELNIPKYQGRYNGPKDLSEFKGIESYTICLVKLSTI